MKVRIQPITFFRDQATQLRIDNVQIRQLGENGFALVFYTLLDDNDKVIHSANVELRGDDYSLWGSDDTFVLEKVIDIMDFVVHE